MWEEVIKKTEDCTEIIISPEMQKTEEVEWFFDQHKECHCEWLKRYWNSLYCEMQIILSETEALMDIFSLYVDVDNYEDEMCELMDKTIPLMFMNEKQREIVREKKIIEDFEKYNFLASLAILYMGEFSVFWMREELKYKTMILKFEK